MTSRVLRRTAFTLIELLIVLLILAGLLSLLFPVIQSSRESARAMSCKNNLRQLDIACRQFMDDNQSLPAVWTVELLPFLEETATNLKSGGTTRPAIFTCPSHTDFPENGPSGGAALYRLMIGGKPRNPHARFVDRSTEHSDSSLVPWTSEASIPSQNQPEGHGPHRGKYLESLGGFLK